LTSESVGLADCAIPDGMESPARSRETTSAPRVRTPRRHPGRELSDGRLRCIFLFGPILSGGDERCVAWREPSSAINSKLCVMRLKEVAAGHGEGKNLRRIPSNSRLSSVVKIGVSGADVPEGCRRQAGATTAPAAVILLPSCSKIRYLRSRTQSRLHSGATHSGLEAKAESRTAMRTRNMGLASLFN